MNKATPVDKFRIARVLRRSFSMFGRHIVPITLLAIAMTSVPYLVMAQLGLRHAAGPFADVSTVVGSWERILATALNVLAIISLQAVAAPGVHGTLQGHRVSARELVHRGFARVRAILALVAVVFVPNFLGSLWLEMSEPGWTLIAIGIGIVSFAASIMVMVAIPAAAIDALGVTASIRRSIDLVWSQIMRIIALILVLILFVGGLYSLPTIALVAAGIEGQVGYAVLVGPDLLLTALLYGFFAVMATVTYYELREVRTGTPPENQAGLRPEV